MGEDTGTLKLISDSRLKELFGGEKELESTKMVVSNILVDRFGTSHLKHSQLTFLSPLYTV